MNARKLSLLLLALGAGLVFESSLFAETSAQRKARLAKQKRTKKTKKSAAKKGAARKGKGKGKRAAKKKAPVAAAAEQPFGWTRAEFEAENWTLQDLQEYAAGLKYQIDDQSTSSEVRAKAQTNYPKIMAVIDEIETDNAAQAAKLSELPKADREKIVTAFKVANEQLSLFVTKPYKARRGNALFQDTYKNVEDFVTKALSLEDNDFGPSKGAAGLSALLSGSGYQDELGKDVPQYFGDIYNRLNSKDANISTAYGKAPAAMKQTVDERWTKVSESFKAMCQAYVTYVETMMNRGSSFAADFSKTNNLNNYNALVQLLARLYITEKWYKEFASLFGEDADKINYTKALAEKIGDSSILAVDVHADVIADVDKEKLK